jgi:VWFA-related protein
VSLIVEDGHGVPVSGLAPSDLSILDNKKPPQSVVSLRTAKQMPLQLGLLIDTSSSQAGSDLYLPGLKAASAFVNQALIGPDDRAIIMTFSAATNASGFMDRDELRQFKVDATPGRGTALYDAVYFSCRQRMKGDPVQTARRVLIVISDGEDNLSHVTPREAIAAALEGGTVIFAVSTDTARAGIETRGDRALEKFASETGGRAFLELSPKDLPKVFAQIEADIEHMYSVTYVPAESGKPGSFQPIEVKPTSNKKLKARAPKGHFVPVTAQ